MGEPSIRQNYPFKLSETFSSSRWRWAEPESQGPLTQGQAEEQEGLLAMNPPGLVFQQGGQQADLCLPAVHGTGRRGSGRRGGGCRRYDRATSSGWGRGSWSVCEGGSDGERLCWGKTRSVKRSGEVVRDRRSHVQNTQRGDEWLYTWVKKTRMQ